MSIVMAVVSHLVNSHTYYNQDPNHHCDGSVKRTSTPRRQAGTTTALSLSV